jgi:hypothetical protein
LCVQVRVDVELVDVAVGVGVGVVGGRVTAELDVGVGVGVGVTGTVDGVVAWETGVGEALATDPEGAVVGLSGLLPVTLPPPELHDAAAMIAEPASNASIKRLNIEFSKLDEERRQRRGEGAAGREKTICVFKST